MADQLGVCGNLRKQPQNKRRRRCIASSSEEEATDKIEPAGTTTSTAAANVSLQMAGSPCGVRAAESSAPQSVTVQKAERRCVDSSSQNDITDRAVPAGTSNSATVPNVNSQQVELPSVTTVAESILPPATKSVESMHGLCTVAMPTAPATAPAPPAAAEKCEQKRSQADQHDAGVQHAIPAHGFRSKFKRGKRGMKANRVMNTRRAGQSPPMDGGHRVRGDVPIAFPRTDDGMVEDDVETLAALLEEEDNDLFDCRHDSDASLMPSVAPGSLLQVPEPWSPPRQQIRSGSAEACSEKKHGQVTSAFNSGHSSHSSPYKIGVADVGQPLLQNEVFPTPMLEATTAHAHGLDPQIADKKEHARVIGAARQWLRARRGDAEMLQRLQALSRLSRAESQRFVADNVARTPGEWNLAVLDARITADQAELSALETPPAHSFADSTPANDAATPAQSGGEDDCDQEERTVQGELQPTALLGQQQKRNGSALSGDQTQVGDLKPIANAATRESVLANTNRPRRRFMPRCPPTELQMHNKLEQSQSSTRWVPRNATEEPVSDRTTVKSDCSHARRSKVDAAGCCWVCLDCGEELYYDGWRHEYSAHGAYPSQAGVVWRTGIRV